MKKLVVHVTIIAITLLAFSCEEKDCCVGLEGEGADKIVGSWLLFESGYSPGAGYVVTQVSPVPPQKIEFKSSGELSSDISPFKDYNYYSVKDEVLGLFEDDPGHSPDSLVFTHSYRVSFKDGILKLSYRGCIEGCHLGFKRIE